MSTQLGYSGYSSLDIAEQWYFSTDDLANTPSQCGSDYSSPNDKLVSFADEQERRLRGCNFIHNVVLRLNMHQFVASTACVFFHRFYMRQSLEKYHHYQIAGACVLLASKVEENKRSLQDITRACANVASKGKTSEAEKSYKAWERLLKQQEIALLENICFDVEIEHPYKSIDALGAEFGIPVYISKAATAHVNDCLRSTICLRYRPTVIAAAALYLAIGIHKYTSEVNLFESRIVEFPSNVEHETESCAMDMLGFYQREAEAEKQAKAQQRIQRPSS